MALSGDQARRIWLRAQRLDSAEPFGRGPHATPAAVAHLGYVQLDAINVVERAHHHVLWTRIPTYRPRHLHQAQSDEKSVFEVETHALSYAPTEDFRLFLPAMRRERWSPRKPWNSTVKDEDVRRVLRLLRSRGPLRTRDVEDGVLVEKDWAWASRKPSKRALELARTWGLVVVSERDGMEMTYDLTLRHFGWSREPRAAADSAVTSFRLDRALRAQGVVSLASVCHNTAADKPAVRELVEARVRRGQLMPVRVQGAERVAHWVEPHTLDSMPARASRRTHILSPFDPLVIQRKRLAAFFEYEHVFEAYVPAPKRVLGYFALPVLVGEQIVAALDLRFDRGARALEVRRWTWVGPGNEREHGADVGEALGRFEAFQQLAT